MSFGNVPILNTATLIVGANTKRQVLTLVNIDPVQPIFIGPDNTVTTANGIPLFEFQTKDQTKTFGSWLGPIYGIVASNTANARFWEVERSI